MEAPFWPCMHLLGSFQSLLSSWFFKAQWFLNLSFYILLYNKDFYLNLRYFYFHILPRSFYCFQEWKTPMIPMWKLFFPIIQNNKSPLKVTYKIFSWLSQNCENYTTNHHFLFPSILLWTILYSWIRMLIYRYLALFLRIHIFTMYVYRIGL